MGILQGTCSDAAICFGKWHEAGKNIYIERERERERERVRKTHLGELGNHQKNVSVAICLRRWLETEDVCRRTVGGTLQRTFSEAPNANVCHISLARASTAYTPFVEWASFKLYEKKQAGRVGRCADVC